MADNTGRNTQQGTGFTDYNTLLNANQASGTASGQAVAGGLQAQGQAVQNDLSNQQNTFNNKLNTSQNQWGNLDTQGQNLINTAGAGNYTGTDANGNAIDPTALGSQIKSYNYTGPTGLTNANQLQTNAATRYFASISSN